MPPHPCPHHCPSGGSGGHGLAAILGGVAAAAVVTLLWPLIERVLIIGAIAAGVLAILTVAAFATGLHNRRPAPGRPIAYRTPAEIRMSIAESGELPARVRPVAAIDAPRMRLPADQNHSRVIPWPGEREPQNRSQRRGASLGGS
jgi:hypothetical protein